MIIRRTSEVIRLATAMSQIQNSDALSYKDKIDMLNQSYLRLYSDLNNNGDLYYVKEIAFEEYNSQEKEHKFKLPNDFWKLDLVGYRGTMGDIVPIERAPNTTQYFSGYRLINNELVFSNYFLPGPLVVRYIPQPQTLTFPRNGYKISGPDIQAAYDSLNDVIILGGLGDITVIDNHNGARRNTAVEGVFVLAVSAGIIYVVQETGILCFDFELNLVSSFEGTFDLYAHSIGWEEGVIVSVSGTPMRYVSGSEPKESEDYWNFLDGMIVKTGHSFIYSDNEEARDISDIFQSADSFVIADPYIYINQSGTVKVYDEFLPSDMAPALVGRGSRKGLVLAAEVNNESGYGVIFRDFYSGLNMIGYAADTVLNYPQNIFFDWLITDLAVKFRIALDIPTGELPALEADYHDTLMRGLSRDAYQTARINNRYGRAFI
jgi:hypothetical protein